MASTSKGEFSRRGVNHAAFAGRQAGRGGPGRHARQARARAWTALLGAAMLAYAPPAEAALAPVYQRQREIAEIIANRDVMRALRMQPIEAVEYLREDLYRAKAGPCSVEVRIVDNPRPAMLAGPRLFHLEIGAPTCR